MNNSNNDDNILNNVFSNSTFNKNKFDSSTDVKLKNKFENVNEKSCDYVSNLSLNSNKKLAYFQIKDKIPYKTKNQNNFVFSMLSKTQKDDLTAKKNDFTKSRNNNNDYINLNLYTHHNFEYIQNSSCLSTGFNSKTVHNINQAYNLNNIYTNTVNNNTNSNIHKDINTVINKSINNIINNKVNTKDLKDIKVNNINTNTNIKSSNQIITNNNTINRVQNVNNTNKDNNTIKYKKKIKKKRSNCCFLWGKAKK